METLTLKPPSPVKLLICLLLSVTGFIPAVEAWIWNPAWTLWIFIALLAFDFGAALALSLKRRQGFNSSKARRFVIMLVLQVITLGIVFNLQKINAVFGVESVQPIMKTFPGLVYLFMFSYNFLSFLKNATLASAYNGPIAKFIKKYIDPHKNEPE